MTIIRLQTVTQYEHNTETGKTRVLKAFTTPLGSGSRAPKKVKKEAQMTVEDVEYL